MKANKYTKLTIALSYIIILLFHLLVFLAFYPGICSYDLNVQIEQWNTKVFNENHPILHTLFVGYFYDLFDNHNIGYSIATILQLLVVDGSICYLLFYVKNKYITPRSYWILLLFYAIFPIYPLLAISHTKDILFASFSTIFFVDLLRIIDDYKPTFFFYIRAILNASLMILFRNNAIHALFITIVILIIITIYLKHKSSCSYAISKILVIAILSFILSFSMGKALKLSTGANQSSIKEMMSLPAQVMGRVYNTCATDSEKEIIKKYIPNPEDYKYYISDPMKASLPFEIWESSCKHFLLDSTIIALHHPFASTTAIILNIQGYFDPINCPYSYEHFYLARNDYRGGAIQQSLIPFLRDLYVSAFYVTSSIPLPLRILFNPGIYVWIFIISTIHSFKKDGIINSIPYIYPMTYLCTLLLGPACIIRYAFLYVILAPAMLLSLLNVRSFMYKR